MFRLMLGVLISLLCVAAQANTVASAPAKLASMSSADALCHKIGKKLSSVSVKECLAVGFEPARFYSVNGLPIVEKHFTAVDESAPRILFIGGIHGDEYSSVSVTFKWLSTLLEHHSGAFDWHFVPLANPDGLLQRRSSRVNAHKVDLNRNFVQADGFPEPLKHWKERAKKRARYYPGLQPLSEPETRVIYQLIEEYKPTLIISVHAPHGILDFDGDSLKPPSNLGPLHLRQLGTYPGSLGNYAWFTKQIPVMTIELEHAGIMPTDMDISRMWTDLVKWVRKKTNEKTSYAVKENSGLVE